MIKYKIYILIVFILSSCKKDKSFEICYFPNGNIKYKTQIDENGNYTGISEEYYNSGELRFSAKLYKGETIDTVFFYYKNGKIKEKGLMKKKLKNEWWISFDSIGKIKTKTEYLIFNNKSFRNQYINYNLNGDTIYEKSRFIKISISDTLKQGANIGTLKFNSDLTIKDKFFYILINNQYSENKIVNDTFIEENNNSRFGVFAHKKGQKTISGIIDESFFEKTFINKDSVIATLKNRKIYFKIKVFVK
jgi:hypothetical protein